MSDYWPYAAFAIGLVYIATASKAPTSVLHTAVIVGNLWMVLGFALLAIGS